MPVPVICMFLMWEFFSFFSDVLYLCNLKLYYDLLGPVIRKSQKVMPSLAWWPGLVKWLQCIFCDHVSSEFGVFLLTCDVWRDVAGRHSVLCVISVQPQVVLRFFQSPFSQPWGTCNNCLQSFFVVTFALHASSDRDCVSMCVRQEFKFTSC